MKNLCELEKLTPRSFSQRLFRQEPKENAFIEINNLFASKILMRIKSAEIEAISVKYNVDIRSFFLDKLKGIYIRYIQQSVSDLLITDAEVNDRKYLKELLQLTDYESEAIIDEVIGNSYKESFYEVISDGKIEESEKKYLNKLQKDIRLSGSSQKSISTESTQVFMQMQIDKIIEDGKISPEEWVEFITMAKNLNVEINWSRKEKAMAKKLKRFWQIEHGQLPKLKASIDWLPNEYCYFDSNAVWMKKRSKFDKLNDESQAESTKIGRGSFYRAGTVPVYEIKVEQYYVIDIGEVFITNKRIFFAGTNENISIQLNTILSIDPFSDGVEIEKENLECSLLKLSKDADLFTMTLSRVINDSHNILSTQVNTSKV